MAVPASEPTCSATAQQLAPGTLPTFTAFTAQHLSCQAQWRLVEAELKLQINMTHAIQVPDPASCCAILPLAAQHLTPFVACTGYSIRNDNFPGPWNLPVEAQQTVHRPTTFKLLLTTGRGNKAV